MLESISNSFESIIHLEVFLWFSDAKVTGIRKLTPVNINYVRDMWNCLWWGIRHAREMRQCSVWSPRLQTLRVRQGGYHTEGIERAIPAQVTFEARLSERDDLADKGVANVVCLELEGLLEKYGKGSMTNDPQRALRYNIMSRADNGSPWEPGLPTDVLGNTWPHIRPLRTTLVALAEGQLS